VSSVNSTSSHCFVFSLLRASASGLFVPRTIRTLDYSYYGWTICTLDDSYDGLFVRWTIRTMDFSYHGVFVLWTVRTIHKYNLCKYCMFLLANVCLSVSLLTLCTCIDMILALQITNVRCRYFMRKRVHSVVSLLLVRRSTSLPTRRR